jgi:anaerobic ribonucleoside-triphosphate reductase activating protein
LCKEFKSRLPEKTIWVYTGFTWEQIIGSGDSREECLKYIDVLCDGPFIERLKSPSKPWVGSENQRVIDVKKSLNNSKIILYA